jgi:DNA repair protein SbcC/Rad50
MLLRQLKLDNVRSYLNETINFSSGSTLLSGDIGTGKSTILLAIEFALFGTSRTDLPAEALLRKSSSLASVELSFTVNDKEVTIKRSLKKERNTIKQIAGHLIINGMKKDLTPVELKAEIVSLLGYPEEFITKSKNYIFRYTIYTPQEEMKFVLQENPDVRLDVLRKIFNIDKYKIIRDNIQLSLKQMRRNIAILGTRTESLEDYKNKLTLFGNEKERLEKELFELSPKIIEQKEKIVQQKQDLLNLEQDQKLYLDLKQKSETISVLSKDKFQQLDSLNLKKEQLQTEIDELSLPEGQTVEQLQALISKYEEEKTKILTEKTSLQQKVSQLQEMIKEKQHQLVIVNEEISSIAEKEQFKQQLTVEIAEKDKINQDRLQLEELLLKTSELVTKNKTLLVQSQELKSTFTSLKNCPTCLQDVSQEHKQKIQFQEDEKIKQAENLLSNLNTKKSDIMVQRGEVQQKVEQLLEKENLLLKTSLELKQLEEKNEQLQKDKDQLKSWAQENNVLMQQLNKFNDENKVEEINFNLKEYQQSLNLISKKVHLQKSYEDINQQIVQAKTQFDDLKQQSESVKSRLLGMEDLTTKINLVKDFYIDLTENEKNLSVKQAQLETQKNEIIKQELELGETVNKLVKEKSKMLRLKELHHWLDAHFLKLTYTIEKQVMLNIHYLFNQLFQEWFSILIDDENVISRIDDTYTPIIELNGYEISFNNLSGGEKTSAALAYRLALNKVINEVVHEIKTKDLLILDEPTDGFSSEQLDKVRDVLEKLSLKQIIIVSHETKIESFVENIVRINKNDGVSQVV